MEKEQNPYRAPREANRHRKGVSKPSFAFDVLVEIVKLLVTCVGGGLGWLAAVATMRLIEFPSGVQAILPTLGLVVGGLTITFLALRYNFIR